MMDAVADYGMGAAAACRDAPLRSRGLRSQRNYHAGVAAEACVLRHYGLRGQPACARRWRGRSGEIDLIVRDGGTLVFVEVKKAVSHDAARRRITQRQIRRIFGAATEYVGDMPEGQRTPMRFDLATVDEAGTVDIIENAFFDM